MIRQPHQRSRAGALLQRYLLECPAFAKEVEGSVHVRSRVKADCDVRAVETARTARLLVRRRIEYRDLDRRIVRQNRHLGLNRITQVDIL